MSLRDEAKRIAEEATTNVSLRPVFLAVTTTAMRAALDAIDLRLLVGPLEHSPIDRTEIYKILAELRKELE